MATEPKQIDDIACALLRISRDVRQSETGSALILRLEAGWIEAATDVLIEVLKERQTIKDSCPRCEGKLKVKGKYKGECWNCGLFVPPRPHP